LVVRLAQIKKKKNIPIYDPLREHKLLSRLKEKAVRRGIESQFVEKLFSLIDSMIGLSQFGFTIASVDPTVAMLKNLIVLLSQLIFFTPLIE
jgi:hypothetical protein